MDTPLQTVPVPPPTITATVPVLDQAATDALAEVLRKAGYEEVWFENVTRITATKPKSDGVKAP